MAAPAVVKGSIKGYVRNENGDWYVISGTPGSPGPTGPAGQVGTIVLTFGASKTPADLPPSGFIPADWDAPGVPPVDLPFIMGYFALYQPQPGTGTGPGGPGDPEWGNLYTWVQPTLSWTLVGKIAGPPGPVGPTGPTGPIGPTGIGITGPTGARILDELLDVDVVTTPPVAGQALIFNPTGPTGPIWVPGDVAPSAPTEVYVDPVEPSATGADFLWVDTSVLGPAQGGAYLPLEGGTLSGDLHVASPYRIYVDGDGYGVNFVGGGAIYKKSGAGIRIRKHSANTQIQIENNDGTNNADIITAKGGTFLSGTPVLQFANEEGAKINLYSTNFGIGIAAGTTVIYTNSRVAFRQNSYNGTEWGSVDSGGMVSAGRRVFTGREANGQSLAANTFYTLASGGSNTGSRWSIVAVGDGASHTVTGVTTYYVTGSNVGYASVAITGNVWEGHKIFDYACVDSGSGYGTSIRCVDAGSYNMGWEAVNHDGNPCAASMGSNGHGTDYGGAGI